MAFVIDRVQSCISYWCPAVYYYSQIYLCPFFYGTCRGLKLTYPCFLLNKPGSSTVYVLSTTYLTITVARNRSITIPVAGSLLLVHSGHSTNEMKKGIISQKGSSRSHWFPHWLAGSTTMLGWEGITAIKLLLMLDGRQMMIQEVVVDVLS